MFEYETQPDYKKTDSNLFIVTTSEFSKKKIAQNREFPIHVQDFFIVTGPGRLPLTLC